MAKRYTGPKNLLHPLHEAESHDCPACHRKTKRRIRRYPTLGYEDARCDRCVQTGKWPEQEEGVKYGSQEEQAPTQIEGQASFGESGGTQ